MRSLAPSPAVQLQSVALRYRLVRRWPPLSNGGRATASNRWSGHGWVPRGEIDGENLDQKIGRLEAVLFLAREPLSSRKLSQYANLADGTEARTLVRRLNERLDQAGRAFRVQEVAGGFQLTTRRKFAKWLRRLDYIPSEERLSAPSLETLAVVAYRQPVMRAEIEAVRGVGCGEILNQLMSRDLIRVGGRSSELGRPYLYNTTKRFLQLFGLKSLDDLPRAELFRQATIQPDVVPSPAVALSHPVSFSEVEEDSDVSVSVELEYQPPITTPTEVDSERLDERHVRMEDEDFEDEEELEEDDEEFEDDFEDEEYEDDEEFEDEEDEEDEDEGDEEFEDDEEYEDEEEEFEDEDLEDEEEFEDEEDEEDEEDDEEEYEDDDEDDDEDEEEDEEDLEDEDEGEWEEVDEEEEDEEEEDEDDEDWEEEDWEDEEEWED